MKKYLNIALALPLFALSGCNGYFGNYWTDTDNYAKPIGQSKVTANDTIYSDSLKCLASEMRRKNIKPEVMTVGRVLDFTGKDDLETGRRITQGATLMVISALDKVGVPQVERFDTSVNEFELKMKDNKLIQNSIEGDERAYQPIMAGSIVGSKYAIMGGVTELNYNIRSNDVNALFDIASGGMRYYVMNVAMDFRLVETETLKIVSTASYQKQIIGREVQAGVFEFFDNKLLDVGVGEKSLEPVQLAVRAISELAVYELLSKLYKTDGDYCAASDAKIAATPSAAPAKLAAAAQKTAPVPSKAATIAPARTYVAPSPSYTMSDSWKAGRTYAARPKKPAPGWIAGGM